MIRNTSKFFDQVTGAWARLGRFVQEVNVGLAALHRAQFDEPWKPTHRPTYGE